MSKALVKSPVGSERRKIWRQESPARSSPAALWGGLPPVPLFPPLPVQSLPRPLPWPCRQESRGGGLGACPRGGCWAAAQEGPTEPPATGLPLPPGPGGSCAPSSRRAVPAGAGDGPSLRSPLPQAAGLTEGPRLLWEKPPRACPVGFSRRDRGQSGPPRLSPGHWGPQKRGQRPRGWRVAELCLRLFLLVWSSGTATHHLR